MLTSMLLGFGTGLSLIVAIGAQNAFVLRQFALPRTLQFWIPKQSNCPHLTQINNIDLCDIPACF